VTKFLRKDLFWLMFSEVSVHGQLGLLFLGCGEWYIMVEGCNKGKIFHGVQEAERDRE
jgi:hypothetical protein